MDSHHKVTGSLPWGAPENEVQWVEYYLSSCAFGDLHASGLLFCCIKRAAEMFFNDEEVHRWLTHFHYVDDVVAGAQTQAERDHIREGIQLVLKNAGLKHCPWINLQHPPKKIF